MSAYVVDDKTINVFVSWAKTAIIATLKKATRHMLRYGKNKMKTLK